MNVLFLDLGNHQSIDERGIYTDLLRVFTANGHEVYIACPIGTTGVQNETVIEGQNSHILKVYTGEVRKVSNLIKKGINTVLLENCFLKAIKKHFPQVRFDLVLYPTPPITFYKVVKYIRQRDGAGTYLMLKDIFPQNAVDIGMMTKNGLKGLIYRYFRRKEKKLYQISDHIGCMSKANVDYLLSHNAEIAHDRVEVCPNSLEVTDKSVDSAARQAIRQKYGIPLDKTVFVYGGNLGRPQGIPFLIRCLEKVRNIEDAFFLIVGNGTEYGKLEAFFKNNELANMKLMKSLPRSEYDTMVGACDTGLIFLDHRFTIPNFPSRLLSYMQARMPVLACTDPNTDIGKVITEGGFGWWCESNDEKAFSNLVLDILKNGKAHLGEMGDKGFEYLCANYSVQNAYRMIMSHMQ